MANDVDVQTMLAALARINDLHERLRDLERHERAGPIEDWTNATLLNSWENYNAFFGESQFNDAGYYRDWQNRVYIRGLITNGILTTSTVIFTLPVGYRPPRQIGATIISSNAFGRIDVTAAGEVVIVSVPSNGFVFIDGISFRAA